jgi:hypothetical protein
MLANGIKETTATTGTGTVTLVAVTGYARFSGGFAVGLPGSYAIRDGNNWEWGVGTVGAGNTLARTTITATLVGGTYIGSGATAITLASGAADVICTDHTGTVRPISNLTGHVTSVGNATSLGSLTAAELNAAISDADVATLGANTFSAAQELPTGTAIASAATVNLNDATGNRVHITGATTITAVTLTRGPRTVIFDGILTLTHHITANNLPGGANITTAAGDRAVYESDGTTVYCVSYFTAAAAATVATVRTPANITPAAGATNQTDTPTLTAGPYYSLYGVTMAASQWQVSTDNTFATTLISSGDQAGTAVTYTLTALILSVSTTYYWRVRYKDTDGAYSAWSTPFSFVTAAGFAAYIATPTATPAIGAAFEGGYYTGLIWNEMIQSATSFLIGMGNKTFEVSSVVAYAYLGQALEVRSRANPDNKMLGTVTAASLTSMTINITSIVGSGTFTDWSIMSKYRVIVSPRATGESASLAYKNADTAAPAACLTLTEGRKATLAMVAAGNATIYPAANFCNNLSIASKTDWYLPARDELELIWRNLKCSAASNTTLVERYPYLGAAIYQNLGSYGDASTSYNLNLNSSPAGAAYTAGSPAQTGIAAFQQGGTEALTTTNSPKYISSSSMGAGLAWGHYYQSSGAYVGAQQESITSSLWRVRAVRRSII